jgi:hypothetical protein
MTDGDKRYFATYSRLDVNSNWKYALFQPTHTWHQYKQGTAHLECLTLSGTTARPGHLRPVTCVHNIWSRTRQTAVRHRFQSAIILLVRNSLMTLMFAVPYILVTCMFFSSPTRCTIFFISWQR